MHPTVQTELWSISRRLIKQSTASVPRRYAPPRRSLHRSPRLGASEKPGNGVDVGAGSFPPGITPISITPEQFREFLEQHRAGAGPPKPSSFEVSNEPSPEAPNGGDGPFIPDHQKPVFHGSALRRRLRSRIQKGSTKSDHSRAPGWFAERNVHLYEDLYNIGLVQTVEGKYSRNSVQPQDYNEEVKALSIKDIKKRLQEATERLTGTNAEDLSNEDALRLFEAGIKALCSPRLNGFAKVSEEEVKLSSEAKASAAKRLVDEEVTPLLDGKTRSPTEATCKQIAPDVKYYLNQDERREVVRTTRGLLRLPSHGKTSLGEPSIQKSHLILHYPLQGGEIHLRTLISSLAFQCDSDIMALDAQDIAELIVAEDLGDEITTEGRMLGYDVYNGDNERSNGHEAEVLHFDESEDLEDPMEREENPFGMPGAVGQPVVLRASLSDFMKPDGPRHQISRGSSSGPQSIISALFGNQGSQRKPKNEQHIFSGLINTVLSAPAAKRTDIANALSSMPIVENGLPAQQPPEEALQVEKATHEGTPTESEECASKGLIIHISAIKAIQDTSIGRQFLSELYEQVQRRRSSGQRIIIIGSESNEDPDASYSRRRIDDMQRLQPEEISRTIVLTPVFPTIEAKLQLLKDRRLRTTAINYRHLQEMLRYKTQVALWPYSDPHKEDFLKEIQENAKMPETRSVWSFSYIHRLTAIIWGMLDRWPDKKPRIAEAIGIIEDSDRSKFVWAERERAKNPRSRNAPSAEENRLSKIRATATKHEKALMSGVIEPNKISVSFKDVHAPFETIDAIQTLTTLSLVRPEAFQYGVLASDRIPGLLLYGPPGTGKTMLAKAVARDSGATVLSVSSAQLNNMYVGEGEKNVQALFSLAKKLSPCIIFLDEADAIFSARSNGGRRVSHRELLNQFLTEWDGMSNDAGSALIMVATNRPMDLDDAVLRRLPRRLLVDLPTETDRLEILKIHLRDEQLAEDVDLANLAKKTPFYSGSDLKNAAVAAALECVREEHNLAKIHIGEEPYRYSEKRTLKAKHFEKALEEISASISEDMTSLREIKRFDEQYGDRRGKKRKSGKWGFITAVEADEVLDTVKVRS